MHACADYWKRTYFHASWSSHCQPWVERQTDSVSWISASVRCVPLAMGTAYGYTPSHVIVKRQNYTLTCHGTPRSCLNLREGSVPRLSAATARSGVPPQPTTHHQHHSKQQQQQQQQGNSPHSSRLLVHNCLLTSLPQYYCFPFSAFFCLTLIKQAFNCASFKLTILSTYRIAP